LSKSLTTLFYVDKLHKLLLKLAQIKMMIINNVTSLK